MRHQSCTLLPTYLKCKIAVIHCKCNTLQGGVFSMAQIFTDKNFETQVLESNKVTLVDFWASWCYPCKIQGPIVEQIAAEREDLLVGKLNVEENPQTAQKYNIRSIPTLIIFKDSKPIETLRGLQNKETLIKLVNKYTE